MAAMRLAPLQGPEGLYTVSVMPRFLVDSRRVGWQGAYFTDVDVATQGTVDHGHVRYCVQRGLHREQRRAHGASQWTDAGVGFSVWRAGDAQLYDWRQGGRSQFLFLAPQAAEQLLGEDRALAPLGHAQPQRNRVLELLFDALEADLSQGCPAGPLVGESLIAALLAQLAAQPRPSVTAAAVRLCGRAIDCLETRFARPHSLQELADTCGLGVRQFCRAFRSATGCSPHQYLLRRRVEHAKQLIGGKLPLAEVALQCGFADQSQLTRTFARLVGTTPARYRSQIRR